MKPNSIPTVNGSGSPAPATTKTAEIAEIAVILDRSGSMEAIATDTIIVAIRTDGQENASRTFSQAHIADLIAEKRAQGWEFIFLAANQDAIASATRLSIPATDAEVFAADQAGTRVAFSRLGDRVMEKRGK